ncbi:MAG: hypothetical protein Q9161_009632 [Pseudevernia consocians]
MAVVLQKVANSHTKGIVVKFDTYTFLATGSYLTYDDFKSILDAYTLDETSIQRLERRIQKLVNATQTLFAERPLLYDHNQILININNEAKIRRSIRSIVLGKGERKVMSFEDIEVTRAARAAKEVINGKGKRGRKRKSAAQEADEPDSEPEVARVIKAQEPWRAPVARMI